MADLLALALIVAAGMSTVLGVVPALAARRLSHRSHDTLLAFGAGIMLGVAVLDLLLHIPWHTLENPAVIVISSVFGGATVIVLIRLMKRLPLPMRFEKNGALGKTSPAFLLVVALTIHNAPEGLATGVGYAQGLTALGHSIALAIVLQNIPEGFLVAMSVMRETGSRRLALRYAALSGVVEPVAGFIAYFTIALSPQAIGYASGFAAGVMLTVVFFQMIPESHRHGFRIPATAALALGVAIVAAMNLVA